MLNLGNLGTSRRGLEDVGLGGGPHGGRKVGRLERTYASSSTRQSAMTSVSGAASRPAGVEFESETAIETEIETDDD